MGADVLVRSMGAVVLALLLAVPVRAQAPEDCERCHRSREFLLQSARDRNLGARLVVTRADLTGGPHARTRCSDCHTGVQAYPHDSLASVQVLCATCHAPADSLWRRGVHARPVNGRKVAAGCVPCHGGHDIARTGFLPTAAGRAHMREACASCHVEQVRSAALDVHADSIPCTGCHGTHDMLPVPDPATRFIDVAMSRACGTCHAAQDSTYWRDVHGRMAVAQAAGTERIGDARAATCVSCHGEHGIRHPTDPGWRAQLPDDCSACHAEYGTTYRDSYHGKATRVGSTGAAGCADCHDPHAIFRTSDSASSVSEARRLETCRRCHTEATPRFAGFVAHANPRDRSQSPLLFYVWLFMNTVLFGTMIVWGAHTVLWYRRSYRDHKARGRGRGATAAVPMDAALRGRGPFVWRFSLVFRIIHAMIVATFFVLVVTGLPLRFSCAAWAPDLMHLLGGPERAGLFHRIAGVFVFGYFALYAVHVTIALFRTSDRRGAITGPDSIIFCKQDLLDAVAMVKYFVGKGPMPKFGRYSYMEKFDYAAELWGVGIIGFTGFMLWQPEFFGRFFPGIAFNVAIIVHSYEAMIATAFIFMIHFFNVHLRPDKWPLDGVMFHGRATMHYMEEEHPLLAERLKPLVEGREPSRRAVADLPAPPPSRTANMVAAFSGMALLGIGMALIGLILWGSLC